MKYNLTTSISKKGEIVQQLKLSDEAMRRPYPSFPEIEDLFRWVCDTREKGIRKALIKLGWTPPKEEGAK